MTQRSASTTSDFELSRPQPQPRSPGRRREGDDNLQTEGMTTKLSDPLSLLRGLRDQCGYQGIGGDEEPKRIAGDACTNGSHYSIFRFTVRVESGSQSEKRTYKACRSCGWAIPMRG